MWVPYLGGQGDLVNRKILRITRVTILVIAPGDGDLVSRLMIGITN